MKVVRLPRALNEEPGLYLNVRGKLHCLIPFPRSRA